LNPTLGNGRFARLVAKTVPSDFKTKFNTQTHRGSLVRRLGFLGVVTLLVFVSLAVVVRNLPASHAQGAAAQRAQASATAQSAKNVPATVVAANLASRSLALAPRSSDPAAQAVPLSVLPVQLFVATADQPNKLFSFALVHSTPVSDPSATAAAARLPVAVPVFSGASFPSGIAKLAVLAGTGAAGSLGDGGEAPAAEFNLSSASLYYRSGIAVSSDRDIYIADTNNATIRAIAGPSSSEPGIIRSVAGRWASRQNVELSEPLGIALDRSGNLYIADHAANSIDILYSSNAPKSGDLETLAAVHSPTSVAVAPDGHTVYAASSDTGAVIAINTQTHAVRDAGVVAGPHFPSTLLKSSDARAIPQGLATDGAGNLFLSYAISNSAAIAPEPTGEILRLDAFTAKTTVAVRGLANPGELAFDVNGNLFVSAQGSGQILKFAALGVPATGVTLTPPGGAGTTTDFGDVPVGGSTDSTALQSFQLSNNTAAAITNVAASFTGGNSTDFTIQDTSCTSTLAASASCNFNVAFTPTANATTACSEFSSGPQRCANLSVNYAGATLPLLAPVTGLADDFQIACVNATGVVCVPSAAGGSVQITITAGYSATYQFQIVPDANFSGPVTLRCPTDLPAAPANTTGQPTTCGISAGTSVTEPLVSSLVVDVTAGTPAPFNVTFQTTNTAGGQFPPSTSASSSLRRTLILNGTSSSNGGGPARATKLSPLALAILFCFVLLLFAGFLSREIASGSRFRTRALAPLLAFFALLVGVTVFAGCHHTTTVTIANTPAGTYQLTVNGSAQNTSRGFTMTLVVQ
jgi:sugar lactone lactonase YvrE